METFISFLCILSSLALALNPKDQLCPQADVVLAIDSSESIMGTSFEQVAKSACCCIGDVWAMNSFMGDEQHIFLLSGLSLCS